jgi:short-subunit dehydrogenase
MLVTGSSQGIGKATAKYFAQKGWNVVATMRSPEKETELTELRNVLVSRLDVEKKETILESIAKGIEQFGKIDVLVNNAGHGSMGIFEAATEERIRKQFEVNVFGIMNTTKAILPHFRDNKEGLIINLSSMGGKITLPIMSLYHASKFAVEGFTEALSYELTSQNIKVKIVEPGAVNTDFGRRPTDFYFDESLTDYTEYRGKILLAMSKLKSTMLSPEKVAEVVYKASTDHSTQLRYIVGEDANALISLREKAGDDTFLKQITEMFS